MKTVFHPQKVWILTKTAFHPQKVFGFDGNRGSSAEILDLTPW
jgi:hypothetical protein